MKESIHSERQFFAISFFFFSISIADIVNSKCSSHGKWLAQQVKFQDGDMTLNESIPDLDLTILSVDTSVIMPD